MRKLKTEELNRISIKQFKNTKKNPIILVLDNIRSLHNVGSAFRTADAFLVEKIYLCGITGKPPHREIHKTALGATDSVEWVYEKQTIHAIEDLKKQGYKIIGIEQVENATCLQSFTPQKEMKYAFIFGNEAFGVEANLLSHIDEFIEIPQFGTKHSFNVSVSMGIVLWDWWSKNQLLS